MRTDVLTQQRADAQRAVLAAVQADEADQARLYARRMRHRAEMDALWGPGPEGFAILELAGTARIGQVRASTQLSGGATASWCAWWKVRSRHARRSECQTFP